MLKQVLLIAIIQLFYLGTTFTKTNNSSSEEEAIKKVIMNETRSWEQRDYGGMSDAWVPENYVLLLYSSPYTYVESYGWDSINNLMKECIESYKDPLKINFEWSDWKFRVFDDCAFVTYVQKNKRANENTYESREVRFLEKNNGSWKFIYLNSFPKTEYQEFEAKGAEYRLNDAGYILLNQNKINEAIEVFKLNAELYPESSNVYDSLGEAFMKNGDKELAIKNYMLSLKLDPSNKNAEEMINKMRAK